MWGLAYFERDLGKSLGEVSIQNPLTVVQAASLLSAQLRQLGYDLKVSDNLAEFNALKLSARNEAVTPYFDSAVSGLDRERFFWMKLSSPEISAAGLQAFRLDDVSTTLYDWATSYTIGLYMQRGEMLVPYKDLRSQNSVANTIRGRLVYNGELWISTQVRNRMVYETFSKLGLILALIKWIPDSIWAVAERSMATHGHPIRGGYTAIENGFFRWQWAGQNIPSVEWLHLADRRAIQQLADDVCFEMAPTPTQAGAFTPPTK